jgi:hypothetical protein
MKDTLYHIGLRIGGGQTLAYATAHPATLEVHVRRTKDLLPPDIWKYEGARLTTKKALYHKRFGFMKLINATYHTQFTRCVVK